MDIADEQGQMYYVPTMLGNHILICYRVSYSLVDLFLLSIMMNRNLMSHERVSTD